MITFVPYQPAMAAGVLAVWHSAMGDRHPIMPELWTANTAGDPSFAVGDAIVALADGQPVGFIVTKRWRGDFPGCDRFGPIGWIALTAVHPAHQRRGLGSQLLEMAEGQLQQAGVERIVVGGSFHHFLPGVTRPGPEAFFKKAGYTLGKTVWDVRRRLSALPVLPSVDGVLTALPAVAIRPVQPAKGAGLLAFLAAEFPGRWHRDVARVLQSPGSGSVVMGLFDREAVVGFALIHPPGSEGTWRWAGAAPGIAALGPIGIADSQRGRGLGLALLVRSLEALQAAGADETVIDWTDLLDFYGRCGFEPWLSYRLADKRL